MLVSVYITTKNRFSLLRRAIDSVLQQSYSAIEIVIVDDGSSDKTIELFEHYAGFSNIKIIRNEVSRGACAARNTAIANCSGDYITGLDDDDFFLPDRVRDFVYFFRGLSDDSKVSFLYTDFLIKNSNVISLRKLPISVGRRQIKKRNLIGSQVFVRSSFLKSELFDEAMPAWQDYELWFRLINRYGKALKVSAPASYIVDVRSDVSRISGGSSAVYQAAYDIFVNKHGRCFKVGELAILKLNVLMHPAHSFDFSFVMRSIGYGPSVFLEYLRAYCLKKLS